MFSDYHVHSSFSFDSDEPMKNSILKAINLNMKTICFTEHMDINWPIDNEDATFDYDKYSDCIDFYRNTYGDKIEIKKGIELGLWDNSLNDNIEYMKSHDFDYVIGSCHLVNNLDPYYNSFWESKNEDELIIEYFKTVLNVIKDYSNIDTLGHLDYIIRYSPTQKNNYNPANYEKYIIPILEFIIKKDISLEINTANFKSGLDFPNPHYKIIEWFKELGGRYIQVGSDAHKSEFVGYNFDAIKKQISKYNFEFKY